MDNFVLFNYLDVIFFFANIVLSLRAVYMIVASEDNTVVDVYYSDNGVIIEDEYITLHNYDVFTKDAYYMTGGRDIDFTGTRVMSTKPVSVYCGEGWTKIYAPVSS